MKRYHVLSGTAQQIYAIDLTDERAEDGIPAWDFYQALPAPALKAMTSVFLYHAQLGSAFTNTQKTRLLGDGLFEFKTMQGARILYFYPGEPGITILTHGFMKKTEKTPTEEIGRAQSLRAAYLQAFRGVS